METLEKILENTFLVADHNKYKKQYLFIMYIYLHYLTFTFIIIQRHITLAVLFIYSHLWHEYPCIINRHLATKRIQ